MVEAKDWETRESADLGRLFKATRLANLECLANGRRTPGTTKDLFSAIVMVGSHRCGGFETNWFACLLDRDDS